MVPKEKARQTLWSDNYQSIDLVELELPSGEVQKRPVLKQSDGVVICALNESQEILLIESYRIAVNETLLELPAGKLESGEDFLAAGKRELEEECGLTAATWRHLGSAWGAQGISDWNCHYLLAQDLSPGTSAPEHSPHWTGLDTCLQWMNDGTIRNNYTLVGINKALRFV